MKPFSSGSVLSLDVQHENGMAPGRGGIHSSCLNCARCTCFLHQRICSLCCCDGHAGRPSYHGLATWNSTWAHVTDHKSDRPRYHDLATWIPTWVHMLQHVGLSMHAPGNCRIMSSGADINITLTPCFCSPMLLQQNHVCCSCYGFLGDCDSSAGTSSQKFSAFTTFPGISDLCMRMKGRLTEQEQ
jgi:hypothetical protein